jgi:hypothetical protein
VSDDLQVLKLRVIDAARRYYHAHKDFERTQGDDKADKELHAAQAELLRAYGKFLKGDSKPKGGGA